MLIAVIIIVWCVAVHVHKHVLFYTEQLVHCYSRGCGGVAMEIYKQMCKQT